MRSFGWKSSLVAASVVVLALCQNASAQLATYDFSALDGTETNAPVTSFLATAAYSDIILVGATPSAGADSIRGNNWGSGTTPDLTKYFGFTITPNAGNTLSLSSIEFSERRSATGIRNIAVRSSLDNFATDIATFNVPDDTNTRRQTVTFGGTTFNNINSALTFRIYGYATEATTGTWGLGISIGGGENAGNHPANLVINGSSRLTAIAPEASTVALFAVGLVGAVAVRRRTKR